MKTLLRRTLTGLAGLSITAALYANGVESDSGLQVGTAVSAALFANGFEPACGLAAGSAEAAAIDAAFVDAAIRDVQAGEDGVALGDPQWLDADTLVVVEPAAGTGEKRVVIMNADGSGRRVLASGGAPLPSPDGSKLAFQDPQGELVVIDIGSGEIVRTGMDTSQAVYIATALRTHASAWSPEGDSLLAVTSDGTGSELVVVDPSTGAASGRVEVDGVALSPGWLSPTEAIVLVTDREGDVTSYLAIWNPGSADLRRVGPDLGGTVPSAFAVDREHRRIIAVRNLLPVPIYQMDLVSINVDDGAYSAIAETGFVFDSAPQVVGDGLLVLGTRSIALPDRVRTVQLATGEAVDYSLPPGFASQVRANREGSRVAWVAVDHDGSVHVRTANLGEDFSPAWLDVATLDPGAPEVPFADVRTMDWITDDGVELGGLLFTPQDCDGPLPLWVDVHGGPEGGIGPDGVLLTATPLEWHRFAARGWAVLVVDYRSSGLAGLAARTEAPRPLPLTELRDVIAGVHAAQAVAPIDPERVVLAGHSAGGGVALWAATNTTDLAAIIVKESAGDFPPLAEDPDDPVLRWVWGSDAATAAADFLRYAPISTAERRTTPVLFIAGDVPGDGSAAWMQPIYERFRSASTATARFEVFEGEGHTFTRRESLERLLEVVNDFLEDVVGP